MEKKILISFDEFRFRKLLSEIQSAKYRIEEAVQAINAISSYNLDTTGLQDILTRHGHSIAQQLGTAIDKDLEGSVAHSQTLKQIAKKGDMEKFYAILNDFPKPDFTLAQYFAIDSEGSVELSPKYEELIRTDCGDYIQTERGVEIYEAQKVMVEALNTFLKVCPFFSPMNLMASIKVDLADNKIEPAPLAYDRLGQTP